MRGGRQHRLSQKENFLDLGWKRKGTLGHQPCMCKILTAREVGRKIRKKFSFVL